MLLIGETGSGKTSFLNLICNYARIEKLGSTIDKDGLEKLQRFDDPDLENKEAKPMESNTSGAKLYDVAADSTDSADSTTHKADLNKSKFCVIDTPGFGDSRGFDQDKKNVEAIISCIHKEEYINCVCIVINGREARITADLKYVLTEISSILPNPILDKLIFVYTNVASILDMNFIPSVFKTYLGEEVDIEQCIYIDNPYSRFKNAIRMVEEKDFKKESIVPDLKKSFKDTRQVLNKMCLMMKKYEKVHTLCFIQLYEKKIEIEKSILELLSDYDNQKKLEKKITCAEKELDAALRKKQLNSEFRSMKTTISQASAIDTTPVHNTLCGADNCQSNCHLQCRLPMSFDNVEVLKNCACVDYGKREDCMECGHHIKYHKHAHMKWEQKTETVELINNEMQQKFEEAASMEDRAKALKEGLEKQRRDSEAKRQVLSAQLLDKIEEFEKLGSCRNYIKLIESQIGVIELRIGGSTGPEVQDLIRVKEYLDKKLKVLYEIRGRSIH